MFLSRYISKFKGNDDKGLAKYLDDVEDSVGKPGIGEEIKRRYSWITGSTSYWWLVQEAGINKWLKNNGVNRKVTFSNKKTPFEDLRKLILESPVIIHTKKLGGLRGGHIILAVGYDEDNIICHDPFGNAKSNYALKMGRNQKYPDEMLIKHTGKKVRCIYLEKKHG